MGGSAQSQSNALLSFASFASFADKSLFAARQQTVSLALSTCSGLASGI
jgi:hypothetical protein